MGKTCTKIDCNRTYFSKGLCRPHRMELDNRRCIITNCSNSFYVKDFCYKHYKESNKGKEI